MTVSKSANIINIVSKPLFELLRCNAHDEAIVDMHRALNEALSDIDKLKSEVSVVQEILAAQTRLIVVTQALSYRRYHQAMS